MTKRARLDTELVRRGLAASRESARRAIEEGKVLVGGLPAGRAATLVETGAAISMVAASRRFASRGGDKLDGALARLSVAVEGKRWLDAGASSGGFTDRLLSGGAKGVIAVDVGYGQIDQRLRDDARVVVLERTNVRNLRRADLPFVPDGVTADLSFISLRIVLPTLVGVAHDDADFLLLVKPQFEVGRGSVGPGGVVRDPELWRSAVIGVVDVGRSLGLSLLGATPSEPPGPAGNREFFVHLRRGGTSSADAVDRAVDEVLP